MNAPWIPLPWDSEFFEVAIGRVELDGLDASALAEVESDARAAGIACLYGSLDPADAAASVDVQKQGWRLVDAATQFELRPSEPPVPRPPGIELRLGGEADLEAIDDMVQGLAPWSRFAVDPRFGLEAAVRLQRAFVRRAATDTSGVYSLELAIDDRGPVGFSTRSRTDRPAVDGLFALDRGPGVARYLFQNARPWAGDVPLSIGPIAARNIACLRCAGHCNARVSRVRYLYHRWLDEPVR